MYGLQTGLVASMSREVSSVRISTKYGAHNYHNYRVGARGVLHYPQWWSSKRSPKNRHWESLEEGIKLTTWGKVSKKRSELLSVCIWTKLSPNFFLFFPFLQADFPTRVSLGWLRLTMWSGRTLQPLNANCPCPVPLAGFQKDTAGRGESEFSQSSGSIGLCALLGRNTWTSNHVTIVFLYWKTSSCSSKNS